MGKVSHIIGLAKSPWCERHLAPVARLGGWQVLTRTGFQACKGALVVVASVADEWQAVGHGAAATVLMEHGAGLHYDDAALPATSAWRAGRGMGIKRALFLSPGKALAEAHQKAHPNVTVTVVGSTALDVLPSPTNGENEKPLVCVSTHWDCATLPETRSSWPWLMQALPALARDKRWQLCGHWHPFEESLGVAGAKRAFFAEHNITPIDDFECVLKWCDLFITDNSSTLYEFAATGRPVVALNPPWYRKHVHHGLRFWSHVPGLQVDDLAKLNTTVATALRDGRAAQRLRRRAVKAAFGKLDGGAAARAVKAIREAYQNLC